MEPALEIKMVRDNLALAVSLWTAANKGVITSAHLFSDTQVATANAATTHGVTSPPARQTREELLRGVTNQVRSAFVFSIIQTHLTLERVYTTGPLEEADPGLRAARCAIHLLNLSLDQGLLTPVWVCPAEYRRRYEARQISFVLDVTQSDGKPVVWDDFGGLEKFLELLDYCAAWVKPWSGPSDNFGFGDRSQIRDNSERASGGRTSAARSRSDQPAFSPRIPPGPDPVAGFVRNRCHVATDAQCPASSLYQAYKEWCWETGRQALAQRSFGMGLTDMGFTRRRRGQGYHWWTGIRLAQEELKPQE